MFRVRRVHDDVLPVNRAAIREVQRMLQEQFPGVSPDEIASLPAKLHDPFKQRFRMILYVAEKGHRRASGFAIALHDPQLSFCYLDYIASDRLIIGRGVGAALYEHVRDEARALDAVGVFFECLPDEPSECRDPVVCRANAARLRFYEQYGARPITNTAYQLPLRPREDDNLPYLVFDALDRDRPLSVRLVRRVVRAVLERKYGHLCSPAYVDRVVSSFKDDPVRLRPARYVAGRKPHPPSFGRSRERIAMFVNEKHDIHHIRDRGYVESPVRIRAIRSLLESSGMFEVQNPKAYPLKHIAGVHDLDLVNYLKKACALVPEGKSVYPYVFPIRNATRPPREMSVRAGYFCIDTFTPINRNAFPAARGAVDCALSAADEILKGRWFAYALVRPPGHHAERRSFGGFCYFNNAAVAAQHLSTYGRVAILDVDYHHGNGQQDIFYARSDVLTVSIHGDPGFAYPYFTGFADECGEREGVGFNLNLPLPEVQNGKQYRRALQRALGRIREFRPTVLVVCLGLDPAKGDPTGTWMLGASDFEANGRLIGELGLPTLVVQEGGYRTRTLGTNARHFFTGLLNITGNL